MVSTAKFWLMLRFCSTVCKYFLLCPPFSFIIFSRDCYSEYVHSCYTVVFFASLIFVVSESNFCSYYCNKKKLYNIGYAFLVEMSDCLTNQKIWYPEDLWSQLFWIIEVLLYDKILEIAKEIWERVKTKF